MPFIQSRYVYTDGGNISPYISFHKFEDIFWNKFENIFGNIFENMCENVFGIYSIIFIAHHSFLPDTHTDSEAA